MPTTLSSSIVITASTGKELLAFSPGSLPAVPLKYPSGRASTGNKTWTVVACGYQKKINGYIKFFESFTESDFWSSAGNERIMRPEKETHTDTHTPPRGQVPKVRYRHQYVNLKHFVLYFGLYIVFLVTNSMHVYVNHQVQGLNKSLLLAQNILYS